MSGEADQSSNIASEVPSTGSRSVVAAESEAPSSTSSSIMADYTMAMKQILILYEY
jgi:hypothetical protein